jgi:phospholipid/cholesterol/gamma-HCH transport system substrate-binding protein
MADDRYPEPVRHVELKALALLMLGLALVVAFTVYVLYARGTFEETQRLYLMADNSEGVSVGADLTFSGFPVGRVQRIELVPTGQARIVIDVPRKDTRWLRRSSVFTLERGLVGGARLRAFTGNLEDEPLPPDAVRPVLRGDTTDELPALIAGLKRVLDNVERMTARDSDLNTGLAAVRTIAERLGGRYGTLTALLGSEEEARKVIAAIDRANALLISLEALSQKLGRTLDKADARLFDAGGVMDETQKVLAQLNAALSDARASLKKADTVLAEAQKIAANTSAATADLGVLRAQVEASLRKLSALIEEINRKWPFARDTEVKLP